MEEVIAMLRTDAELKKLIGANIHPFGEGSGIQESLTYEFYTTQDNGIKAVDRLDITAIGFSIGKSKQILDRVKAIILTLGDKSLTLKVLKVEQNGGGSLKNVVGDKTMYHFKAFFNITRRS